MFDYKAAYIDLIQRIEDTEQYKTHVFSPSKHSNNICGQCFLQSTHPLHPMVIPER